MIETIDSTHNNTDHSLLRRLRICIYHKELRNKSMDEDELISQPSIEDTIGNNLLEMCQQNALAINNLEKDVAIIRRNTSMNDIAHIFFSL